MKNTSFQKFFSLLNISLKKDFCIYNINREDRPSQLIKKTINRDFEKKIVISR